MVHELLRAALEEGVKVSGGPGAVAYVGNATETLFFEAFGDRQKLPNPLPASKDTIYDLASLTKAVATTTAIMLLRDDGALDLDDPVDRHLPIPAFGRFTIRHLMTHTSGLIAGAPYYKECHSLDEMLQRYAERGLDWEPGSRYRYSDVAFMILGKVVELVAQDSLDAFCAKRVFGPLGMNDTAFKPPASWAARCAATEKCPWRGQIMLGAVHDENAYAVGGVSGHAGLFSTAEDLARFCRALLAGKIVRPSTLDEMTRLGQVACYPWQGLGWQLDPWSSDFAGFLPSRQALGHAGFTGTSIWMDRATGIFAILLGNTCHPSRQGRNNSLFRRTFYTGVANAFYSQKSNVHTGLDRLMREDFAPLRGRRIALLTNQAAVDQLGRPILNVLALAPDVTLRLLYSPEHGIRGQAEAGEEVNSGTLLSPNLPVPVISLYGKRTAPSLAELAQVDYFLVDLQDVGSRYYTYAATMKACMAACAKARKPVLVLDRPNPVGGAVLEGPIAADTARLTCWAPVPVRHGMTMGEIATFFKDTQLAKLDLKVNTLDNWSSVQLFNMCSLPWVPPSPNMPTAATALRYVGSCLFEGTNLSEGRGTRFPFLMVGAPWLDAQAVVDAILFEERLGCSLHRNRFIPESIPGKAQDPKYKGEVCWGLRIRIHDALAARPFTMALAIIAAIRRIHPDQFRFEPSFDVLTGSSEIRERLEAGESATSIAARFQPALDAFDKARPRLYA